jgi:hypothetical protein
MSFSILFRRNQNQSSRNFETEQKFHEWLTKNHEISWAVLVRNEDGEVVTTVIRNIVVSKLDQNSEKLKVRHVTR